MILYSKILAVLQALNYQQKKKNTLSLHGVIQAIHKNFEQK